jgi:hypothetical protein
MSQKYQYQKIEIEKKVIINGIEYAEENRFHLVNLVARLIESKQINLTAFIESRLMPVSGTTYEVEKAFILYEQYQYLLEVYSYVRHLSTYIQMFISAYFTEYNASYRYYYTYNNYCHTINDGIIAFYKLPEDEQESILTEYQISNL